MLVGEYRFTDYYHKYVTIEADELTAALKGPIKVNDKDCYALCSSYCDEEGYLKFNVLSIGESWEKCTRGLKNKQMLGEFGMEDVIDKTMRVAQADYLMVKKNQAFLEEKDENVDVEILKFREDARLDDLRDAYYPDVVYVSMIYDLTMHEYALKMKSIQGPFLVGELLEEPAHDIGVHEGDPIYALPHMVEDGMGLFALFGGKHLNSEQKEIMNRIVKETDEIGFDFNGLSLKN